MVECWKCEEEYGEKYVQDNLLYECPFCGMTIADGLIKCGECGRFMTRDGSICICPLCKSEGIFELKVTSPDSSVKVVKKIPIRDSQRIHECWQCGEEYDENYYDKYVEYECPYCFETDQGEGFITCEECGALINYEDEEWICEFCHNGEEDEEDEPEEVIIKKVEKDDDDAFYCPSCGAEVSDPGFCDECGWGEVNQGWLGEHYG